MSRRRVVFLMPYVKHYRLPFFDLLYEVLKRDDIDLRVLYGEPNGLHCARKDNVELPSSYGHKVASYWFADRFVYQSAWPEIAAADLVITVNEHKVLLNPMLLALRAAGAKRVAFWGKGDVVSMRTSDPGAWLRYKTANAVDWWFAYTQASAANLRDQGVLCGITAVGNSTDTSQLRHEIEGITDDCLRYARYSIGLSSSPVGIYCGNLSPNKHLDFLFEASKLIRQEIPTFSLLVVGNGPMSEHVRFVATRERFIRYVGPRIGPEKALLLKMGDVFLLPGSVGLGILDSFAAGLPLLTTELATHGPELAYLAQGINGLMTAHDPAVYAESVVQLLRDPERMRKMRCGAWQSGREHTIENMVENFHGGILSCLALEKEQLLFTSRKAQTEETAKSMRHLPGGHS